DDNKDTEDSKLGLTSDNDKDFELGRASDNDEDIESSGLNGVSRDNKNLMPHT
ncbi:hypothetical protein M9458_030908, partial [Cirrhinus mrigala]